MGPRLEHVRLIPLFRGFADHDLTEIASLFTLVTLRADGLLFDSGDRATALYLLAAGEVTLVRPADDTYLLRPAALIGELGALTGLPRSCCAVASKDAEVWSIEATRIQSYFGDNQELGVRFLVNLLETVADKVHRDQRRIGDMRQNLVRTQKALKQMRELVLESPETVISAPVHDTLDQLITHNRRVNYRIEPPPALRATFHPDAGLADVIELSRTHLSVRWPAGETLPVPGDWMPGVLDLGGTQLPASGKVVRNNDGRVAIELDLFIDEYASTLEGFLTRVQLLDILV